MLKLTQEHYDEALEAVIVGLVRVEDQGLRTQMARAMTILEALGEAFDVAIVDPGVRNDVAEGNVWPEETDEELLNRATADAIDTGVKFGIYPGAKPFRNW